MKSIVLSMACFLFSTAWAAEPTSSRSNAISFHRPSLADVLRAGDVTIPAAWSGIWDFSNTDYDCNTHAVVGSDADTDTLCTGESVFGGSNLSCTGTTSDTNVDVNCTATEKIAKGCSVTYSFTLTATRNGDSLTSTSTFSFDYTPDLCAFAPDQCVETQSTATRVGPEPPDCTTAVEEMSWGRVKATYR